MEPDQVLVLKRCFDGFADEDGAIPADNVGNILSLMGMKVGNLYFSILAAALGHFIYIHFIYPAIILRGDFLARFRLNFKVGIFFNLFLNKDIFRF